MPTIDVKAADKARLNALCLPTPNKRRPKESFASVVKRILDEREKK